MAHGRAARGISAPGRPQLYLLLIAGHVLVTLREAFAVAPGVDAARVVAVRRTGPGIYGRPVLDCMLAGRWTRTAFNGVRWADADAGNILADTAAKLVLNHKRGQVFPVDLSTEPEIRDLLSHPRPGRRPARRRANHSDGHDVQQSLGSMTVDLRHD